MTIITMIIITMIITDFWFGSKKCQNKLLRIFFSTWSSLWTPCGSDELIEISSRMRHVETHHARARLCSTEYCPSSSASVVYLNRPLNVKEERSLFHGPVVMSLMQGYTLRWWIGTFCPMMTLPIFHVLYRGGETGSWTGSDCWVQGNHETDASSKLKHVPTQL